MSKKNPFKQFVNEEMPPLDPFAEIPEKTIVDIAEKTRKLFVYLEELKGALEREEIGAVEAKVLLDDYLENSW